MIPGIDDVKTMDKDALRREIQKLGGDWNEAENKMALATRVIQLRGTPEVATKIQKELAKAGFAAEDKPIYAEQPALKVDEMKKAMKPFIEKGVQFRISKDGKNWAMRFDTDKKIKIDGEMYAVVARDSGSTTIPLKVLTECAQLLVQAKKRPKVSKNKADQVFEDNDEEYEAA